MRIKLIRDDLGIPSAVKPEASQVVTRGGNARYWKLGTVLEVSLRGAQLLVGNGDAEPADDEAEAACVGWQRGREEVLLSRRMLAAGIEPEDRERYRRGELLGYDTHGNDIPGPNWVAPEPDDTDEEDT